MIFADVSHTTVLGIAGGALLFFSAALFQVFWSSRHECPATNRRHKWQGTNVEDVNECVNCGHRGWFPPASY